MAAAIPVALSAASTVMTAVGRSREGDAAMEVGRRRKQESQFAAKQMRQQAVQEVAAAQRKGMEERRQADLVASRALAVAAASGGGASDPGVMRILSDIEGEGAYRSAVALYQGKEAARELEKKAYTTEYEGELAMEGAREKKRAARFGAFTSLLKGGASMYKEFGPKSVG